MDSLKIWSMISRKRPTPLADGQVDSSPIRLTPYGELAVSPMGKLVQLADEGSYFTIINPALLTGLATIAAPVTGADIEPFIIIRNNDVVGGKRIYPDYIRLLCSAAGTAGTDLHVAVKLDNVPRYTSGSTLTTTPKNTNMASGEQSIAQVYAGPLVAAAASVAQRIIAHTQLKDHIPLTGDEYILKFGHEATPSHPDKLSAVSAGYVAGMPPVVLGPGDSMLVHLFIVTQSAASSNELDMGWYER